MYAIRSYYEGGKYKAYEPNGELREKEYSDLLMPLASMVDFDRPKKVTKTGKFKELCEVDDWNITINGIILPDKENPVGQRTVAEQMDAIQKFHEIAGSIEVEGQLFAQRHISRILPLNLSFKPVQGRPNMMQFSIDAISDEDLLLTDLI